MSKQWWKDYERTTGIAGCEDLSQVTPLYLNQTGQSTLFTNQIVLQYTTGAGKGLIITRFEGYATGTPPAPIANALPTYCPFPITTSGGNQYPLFDWTNTDLLAGDPRVMMPQQPGSVFNCDCLLGAVGNRIVTLTMTNDPVALPLYNWSVRAYGWLVPEAVIANFQSLFTLFDA